MNYKLFARAIRGLLLCHLFMLTFISCKNSTASKELLTENTVLPDAAGRSSDWPSDNAVVVITPAEPDQLHPTDGATAIRREIFHYLHRFLIETKNGSSPQPYLLESLPEISTDQLRYDCTLKKGVLWDNGKPLTAADVEFTFKVNIANFIHGSQLRSCYSKIHSIEKDPKDPMKFTINMKRPDLLNTYMLGDFQILQQDFHDPNHALERYSFEQLADTSFSPTEALLAFANEFNDPKYGRQPAFINGLGPYRLAEWNSRESIVLERKKTADQTIPEKIIYRFSGDEAGVLLELKKQSYDVACNLSVKSFLEAASDASIRQNYHCVMTPTYGYSCLIFNTRPDTSKRKSLFADREVRQAIARLIPCDAIIHQVYREFGTSKQRMGSCEVRSKQECDTSLSPVEVDPNSALALLSIAGWKDTDNDGILDRNGIKLEADLTYSNSGQDWKDMATLIADALGKSGMLIHLVPVESKDITAKGMSHDFDLLLTGKSVSSWYEDYSQQFSVAAWTSHGGNYTGFGSEATERLIDSINAATTSNQRIRLSKGLQRIIYEEQPMVLLYNSLRRNLVHKRWGHVMIKKESRALDLEALRLID